MSSIKNILAIAGSLLLVYGVRAQQPAWSLDPGQFQYSMTITAFLNVNGQVLTDENDRAGAFVGGELRGVTSPIFVSGTDRYLAYLTVYANTDGEQVVFKLYDNSAGLVVDADTTLTFSIDGHYGNVFQAFSIASPALSREAEIKNFYFAGLDSISTVINHGEVNIVLGYNQDITSLTPGFIVSEGARMYIDRSLQESGTAIIDFTDPIAYDVLSEDESVLDTYLVTVGQQQAGEGGFSSTNVITANNDGHNDYWIVQDAFIYNDHIFKIFDVNGRIIYESVGYRNDWDGRYNGNMIDKGKYYYVIENRSTGELIKGSILVLY